MSSEFFLLSLFQLLYLCNNCTMIFEISRYSVVLAQMFMFWVSLGFDRNRRQKPRSSGGSVKRKDIDFDDDSPPRKSTTAHRRMKMVYESDED